MNNFFNVKDFGAVSDGLTIVSPEVQKAVDACSLAGGGTVFFPKGIYVLATVFLKDNVHIQFEDGTDILGAPSFYDYEQQETVDFPLYQDASHSYFNLAMFVGKNVKNIAITGKAKIDMLSVWDEDDVRKLVHRGPKCISLKECEDVTLSDFEIANATDLAIYFAGCNNVDIHDIKMQVYIDGISPDNSKNVNIYNCDVEAGDDGIVFKSSYNLNRIDICKNIKVWNCRVKSHCSAIKFGTETNGGFEDILIDNIDIVDTRITGIAIESVDGAIIDGITIKNVRMKNTNGLLFVHLGQRMRGPEGREVGEIRNVTLENITADGPYVPHTIMPTFYLTYRSHDWYQYPWVFEPSENKETDYEFLKNGANSPWQLSSNMCGLPGKPIKNLTLRNVHLKVNGGVTEYEKTVPDNEPDYPEIMVYGWTLPAKGIYFRYVEGLTLDHVTVDSFYPDAREDFVFEYVTFKE
ncbi:MAG: hypothetical protein IJA08_06740 [Clostridia bacterium]|nr:hypothetical protein [Clostridia bacterium]